MWLFLQVFVNSAQRDTHQDKEHSPHKSSSASALLESTTTPIKPTISVNLTSSTNNPHRIIVVKSPTKSPTSPMTTTILKKVEVIQPQKCGKCNEFVSPGSTTGGTGGPGYHHKCDLQPFLHQPWQCPHCDVTKSFKIIASLRKHCREVHMGKGQVVICEACTLAFKDLRSLEVHNREKHSSIPSSPESFHGFATPTKELEMSRTMETVILNLNDLM